MGGYDVYMLDTAGRLHIDEVLMDEVEQVSKVVTPRETLLVVDGLTGQVAVEVAQEFDDKVGISGVVLTRMDGDGRGGAALSMRAVTGKPIKFVGLGEKMDALETFEPERIAGRILGMGDIVALVEKAQETIEAEQAERMMKRFQKGQFNMNDLKMQLEQMIKMGGMQGIMGMMPGMNKMAKQAEAAGMDDKVLKQQIALIQSMTKRERANPQILQASRKKRIAAGAGLEVSDLNKLLKMQRQMADMMKKMGKMGKGKMLKQAMKGMFGKGGMPDMPPGLDPSSMDPKALEQAAKAMGGKLPGGLPGLGGGGLPPGLSGFGRRSNMISPVTLPCPGAPIAEAARAALPVLRTPRLVLRAPELGDFEVFERLFSLPSAKFIDQDPDEDAIWAQFTNYAAGWILRGDGMFTVCQNEKIVGFVFAGVEPGDQAIELGFFIAPEAQRKGFAFEAAEAALAHLRSLGPKEIVSYVAPQNTASQALVTKLGGEQIGTLDGALVFLTRSITTAARRHIHDRHTRKPDLGRL